MKPMKTLAFILLASASLAIAQSRSAAVDFRDAYRTNPLAFEKFIGRRIVIYGIINEIGKTKDGAPYVEVGTPPNMTGVVRFIFAPEATANLSRITGAPPVAIEGALLGMVDGKITFGQSRFVR